MKITILLFFLTYSTFHTNGQETIQPPQRLSTDAAKSDFRSLILTLREYHPALHEFVEEKTLEGTADSILHTIRDSISELQLHQLVRIYLARIGCGHTVAIPSEASYAYFRADYAFIPFDIYYVEGKMYIKELHVDGMDELTGAELISIEQKPVTEIIQELKQIQPRDGWHESFIDYNIQDNFRTYYRFLYGHKPTYEVEYKQKGNTGKIILPAETTLPQKEEKRQLPDTTRWKLTKEFTHAELYQFKRDSKWNMLRVKSFNTRTFKKTYKAIFKEIDETGADHLVVDLRGNGGGYFPNGNYFLRYFMREKFSYHFYESDRKKSKDVLQPESKNALTKFLFTLIPDRKDKQGYRTNSLTYKPIRKHAFNGSVFVLTNGGTFSMASSVASYLKHKTEAQFIGTETGGGDEGSNGILMSWFVLPASQIRVMIPFFHVDHAFPGVEKGRGVLPHVAIDYSIDDLLQQKDKELEYIETWISK
ncbi:hypothetical protein G5B10_06405 [Fluviicola sp. SGL-29]|nr:hypothetical protein [Fluviicola sp. SGL-29]